MKKDTTLKKLTLNKKFLVVGGPTCSGKTSFAISLAREFNAELINCDSRQVYKYLDIGTNKGNIKETKTGFEISNISIHLVSFLNPDESYSIYQFQNDAHYLMQEITKRGKLPILVG